MISRKLVQIFFVLAVSALLSGCFIQSLAPFYTDDAVIDSPIAKGQWKFVGIGDEDVSDNYKEPWVFTEDTIETFEKGVKSILTTKYFTIEKDTFVDFFPSEPNKEKGPNKWWVIHIMPVHSVCKVDIAEDTVSLTPLNGDWIIELIEKKKLKLSHASSDPDRENPMLTASSKDLMVFLKKHKNRPEAFPKDNRYIFKKGKSSNKPDAPDKK